MTNEIDKNWKAITSMSIAAVLIVAIVSFNPLQPNVVEAAAAAKQTGCVPGPDNVKHWDKIMFTINTNLVTPTEGHETLVQNTMYDIKVPDDVTKVADLRAKTADFLNGIPYFNGGNPVSPFNIIIQDVEYAIFCIAP